MGIGGDQSDGGYTGNQVGDAEVDLFGYGQEQAVEQYQSQADQEILDRVDPFSGQYFDKEKDNECQGNEHDSVFGGTHVLLVMVYRIDQVYTERGVFERVGLSVGPHFRDTPVKAEDTPVGFKAIFSDGMVGGKVADEAGRFPVACHMDFSRFADWDEIYVAASVQF